MVSFGWPLALLLLPAPALMRFLPRPHTAEVPVRIPPLLAHALAQGLGDGRTGSRWLLLLLWLSWTLLVVAIAQPSLIAGTAVKPASGRAMMVVIDLSSSMERPDFFVGGAATDRLTALKSVARDFIQARQGDRIGLVLFGDEAFSAAPISYDLASIAHALEESAAGMAGRATAIGDALGLAIVKLRADSAPTKAILLLSDGTNNSGEAEPEDAARLAASMGIRIHTIGMASNAVIGPDGTDPSADLDEETLQRVAEIGGGRFFRARTTEELATVYAEIDRLERSEADAPPVVPKVDIRNWLLLGLVASLVAFGLLRRRQAT